MEKNTRKYVPKSVRLMDQVREVLRLHHYAYNTEKSYVGYSGDSIPIKKQQKDDKTGRDYSGRPALRLSGRA